MLSPTEIVGKTFVSWKVFAMPSRLIRSGGRPAISRPAKLTRPLVGAYSPDTTLKSVDLPAPFGPITEKTWPWTPQSRRGGAPRARRSSWRSRRPRGLRRLPPWPGAHQAPEAEEPLGHEEHDQDQDHAD